MPPNTHQVESEVRSASFEDHFWALDKSGMENLFGYVKSALANLGTIHTVYTRRAEIEQEYGQKLQELSTFIKPKEEDCTGTATIHNAMSSELECVSNSHLELSKKMETQVAVNLKKKMDHFEDVLEKWSMALEDLFDERQHSTLNFLKLQSKYLKERESARGKPSPIYESLKNQYSAYEEEVNKLSQEWNDEWRSACKTMDTMEYRRFDILKDTLCDYADLTSEITYIQDKWSEFIRVELENYNVEEEIQNCISNHGTGSHVPTVKEYVVDVYQRRKQKKIQKKALSEGQKMAKRNSQIQDDSSVLEKYHQRDSIDSFQEQPNRPPSAASAYSDRSSQEQHAPQPPVDKTHERFETEKATRIRKIISENTGSTAQRGQIKRKPLSKSFMEHASNQRSGTKNPQQQREPEKIDTSHPKSVGTAQKNERRSFSLNDSLESMLRNFESPNDIGDEPAESKTSRLHQQSYEHKPDTGSISSRRGNANNQILKNTEKMDSNPLPSPPKKNIQNTHILKEIERPGPESNSVSKGNNYLRKYQNLDQTSKYGSQNDKFTNGVTPVVPPKSPRPSPRPSAQVLPEKSQSATFSQNQATQHQNNNNSDQLLLQQQLQNTAPSQPPTSPMIQNQYALHSHPQQRQQSTSYTGQPPIQQQQHHQQQYNTLGPQNQYSYPRQVSQSPMMHPQRSPSMQPQRSPSMQPQRSPMMQAQPSPQPQQYHSMSLQLTPVMQPTSVQHYGTHRGPPPSPIAISNGNYFSSPQPSPSIPYAAPISPGGTLPPAYSSNQPYTTEAPRPTYYGDGTPILFWATSNHTHLSQAEGGLSFHAGSLVAVLKEEREWWTGATWDSQTNSWSPVGLAPNERMYKV